jgi:hypothetical protein
MRYGFSIANILRGFIFSEINFPTITGGGRWSLKYCSPPDLKIFQKVLTMPIPEILLTRISRDANPLKNASAGRRFPYTLEWLNQ